MDHISEAIFSESDISSELPKIPPLPFAAFLKEEEEEEEPLLDGPVTTPFSLYTLGINTPSIGGAEAPLPPPLVPVVKEVIPAILSSSQKGITRTEITLSSKTLSEIKVTIDHYDTAPHSFNIEFSGSEKLQALIAKHTPQLLHSFGLSLPTFHINLLPPKNLLVKSRRVGYVAKVRQKDDA